MLDFFFFFFVFYHVANLSFEHLNSNKNRAKC